MSAGLRFHTITGCVGGFVLLAFIQNYQSLVVRAQALRWNVALQDSATALHPPEYSPTADADPSVRHEVLVPMPTRLSVERKSDRLSVGFHLASPRKVKITVGKKMSIGVKFEMRVYAKGDARPPSPGSIGYASIKEPITPSELGFLNGRAFLNSADGGIPAPAKRYVVEEDVSIFETDIPAQHMWSPESGRLAAGPLGKVGGKRRFRKCAGINRHVIGNERVLQERRERIHLGPESCSEHREVLAEA
jgi:hypothetical protein